MDEENKNLPVPEDPEGPEEAKEPEKLENIVYDWARSLAAAVAIDPRFSQEIPSTKGVL